MLGRFACLQNDVCCMLYLSNHVSPARPWPRPCTRTSLWRTWIWLSTRSAQKGQRCGIRWGSIASNVRIHQGNVDRQCSAVLIDSQMCQIFLYKYILENDGALFGWNLWWHLIAVLVRLWRKTHQVYLEIKSFTIYCNNKAPCHSKVVSRATMLILASQSYGCCGNWNMVHVAGDSPKSCRNFKAVD